MKHPVTSVILSLLCWLALVLEAGALWRPAPPPEILPPIDAQIQLEAPAAAPPHAPPAPPKPQNPIAVTVPVHEIAVRPHHIPQKVEHKLQPPIHAATPPAPAPQPVPRPAPAAPVATPVAHSQAAPLYQPLPPIPESLRAEAFTATAVARFHIATDGSATVELIQPCSNPHLNRILLSALKTWKFKPATEHGAAVASTLDIRVHFDVQ